jgi:hypothetical protein
MMRSRPRPNSPSVIKVCYSAPGVGGKPIFATPLTGSGGTHATGRTARQPPIAPEHLLDSATHTARGFRPGPPDQVEHRQHLLGGDGLDGQIADDRLGVTRENIAPLLPVFRVAPAGFVAGDVLLRRFAKRSPLRLRHSFRFSTGTAAVNRVDHLAEQLTGIRSLLPSIIASAQTHKITHESLVGGSGF